MTVSWTLYCDTSLYRAATRSDRRHTCVDNLLAAVRLHRYHEAKAMDVDDVKQSHDQFLLATLDKPQRFRTKW